MGISKKKFKKGIKVTDEEVLDTLKQTEKEKKAAIQA